MSAHPKKVIKENLDTIEDHEKERIYDLVDKLIESSKKKKFAPSVLKAYSRRKSATNKRHRRKKVDVRLMDLPFKE